MLKQNGKSGSGRGSGNKAIITALSVALMLTSTGLLQSCGAPNRSQSELDNIALLNASANDWHNRLRTVTLAAAAKVPVVGEITSVIVSMFWPEREADIWSLIAVRVEKLIDKKIFDLEKRNLEADLTSLRKMIEYYNMIAIREKGSTLNILVKSADDIFYKLQHEQNPNSLHMLPLSLVLAHVHLGLLKERALHGKELFAPDNSQDVWDAELVAAVDKYTEYFNVTYTKWKEWRRSQIEIDISHGFRMAAKDHKAVIKDTITGKQHEYKVTSFNAEDFVYFPEATKERLFNEANKEFIKELSAVFTLNRFIRGQEEAAPKGPESMTKLVMGPYSARMFGGEFFKYQAGNETCDSALSKIGKIDLRIHKHKGNDEFIESMKMTYANGEGYLFGNQTTATEYESGNTKLIKDEFSVEQKLIKRVKTWWTNDGSSDLLTSVEFGFNDGASSGKFGHHNTNRWRNKITEEVAEMEGFSLANVCGRSGGYGPGVTVSMAKFEFWIDSLLVAK